MSVILVRGMREQKVVITGAAGLVGQNLVPRLQRAGVANIVAIDKHPANSAIFRRLHPDLRFVEADMAQPGPWQDELAGCTHLVSAHAQIGGVPREPFVANNVTATERMLEAAKRAEVPYIVSISSSVVNSMAVDYYTETKKQQEALIAKSGIAQVVLRPTLMFGWFDRKHVGWLARFMQRVPVFPIPGDGRYLRQPLYAGDFCDIITACIREEHTGAYNITGQQRIDYIDLMKAVKVAAQAKARIVKIPYGLFYRLLQIVSLFDKNAAFTPRQLQALVTPDVFEVIDWPTIFHVQSTPLDQALRETFQDPKYGREVLEF